MNSGQPLITSGSNTVNTAKLHQNSELPDRSNTFANATLTTSAQLVPQAPLVMPAKMVMLATPVKMVLQDVLELTRP